MNTAERTELLQLIRFVMGEAPPESLNDFEGTEIELRSALSGLFHWIDAHSRYPSIRPLSTARETTVMQGLSELVSKHILLSILFSIEDNELGFRTNVDKEVRREVIRCVSENYSPPLRQVL